ncbi:hypothetical protein ACA910_004623 [Epithemia clementina (nom. ined.)]
MVYVSADGTVGGKKSLWKSFTEFVAGIFNLIALFFTTMSNPQAIEQNRRSSTSRTYAQRNQGRSYRATGGGQSLGGGSGGDSSSSTRSRPNGSNIRGLSGIGDANCQVGGG